MDVLVVADYPFVTLVWVIRVEIHLHATAFDVCLTLDRQHRARLPRTGTSRLPIVGLRFRREIDLMVTIVDIMVVRRFCDRHCRIGFSDRRKDDRTSDRQSDGCGETTMNVQVLLLSVNGFVAAYPALLQKMKKQIDEYQHAHRHTQQPSHTIFQHELSPSVVAPEYRLRGISSRYEVKPYVQHRLSRRSCMYGIVHT